MILLTRYMCNKSEQIAPWVVGDLKSLECRFFLTWPLLFNL